MWVSRRKLHLNKISSPHQYLLYPISVSSCPIKPISSCCQNVENVLFKALSNKSTLERCHLSPTDYCIKASRKNLHLPERYPLKLCLLEPKNKHSFCLLSYCFGWRISFSYESWKTARLKQRYGEGSVPFRQATFSQSHWSGTILSVFVLKFVAILWSQVQHSSEGYIHSLTRVTILDPWKIGVKKNGSKIWPQSIPSSSNGTFKRSAGLSFLPWRLLFEISLWI